MGKWGQRSVDQHKTMIPVNFPKMAVGCGFADGLDEVSSVHFAGPKRCPRFFHSNDEKMELVTLLMHHMCSSEIQCKLLLSDFLVGLHLRR